MDPIELLERVKDAPLDEVLTSLREIHRQRNADPSWLPARDLLRRLLGGDPKPLRGLTRLVGATDRAAATDEGPPRRSYDSVRELFHVHERELRRRTLLTDRVLDQLRRGDSVARIPTPAPLQQDLRILCPASGASGGRFVVANETRADQNVRFELGAPRRGAPAWAARLTPTFDPVTLHMEPGGSQVVRVSVDLTSLPALSGEFVELPVDVRGSGVSLGRLWLELAVVDPDEMEGR